jgi:hypothetical protein
MDDALYGTRDERGDWKPLKLIQYPPVFVWPVQPAKFATWFLGYPGYILPWNLFYAAAGAVLWLYLTPSMETIKAFSAGWLSYLLVRNAVIVVLFFGYFHLRLYIRKRQGTSFKFNGKWPSTDHSAFLFRTQVADNMIWTLGSAFPVWTAYEALTLWLFANGYIPSVSFEEHPITAPPCCCWYGVARYSLYVVHRLIHWPPLQRPQAAPQQRQSRAVVSLYASVERFCIFPACSFTGYALHPRMRSSISPAAPARRPAMSASTSSSSARRRSSKPIHTTITSITSISSATTPTGDPAQMVRQPLPQARRP